MSKRWIVSILGMFMLCAPVSASNNAIDITDFSGSTRAAAMGYTHTAMAQGTDSLFYNPAGSIFFRKGLEFKSNSVKQFGDIQNTQFALGLREAFSGLGMGLAYYRSELSGVPLTDLQDNQQVQVGSLNTVKQIYTLNLSSYLMTKILSLGINIKSYQYDFSLAHATGLGIDAGLLARFESENQNFFAPLKAYGQPVIGEQRELLGGFHRDPQSIGDLRPPEKNTLSVSTPIRRDDCAHPGLFQRSVLADAHLDDWGIACRLHDTHRAIAKFCDDAALAYRLLDHSNRNTHPVYGWFPVFIGTNMQADVLQRFGCIVWMN
jgi:hypothetical protein